MRWGLKMLKNEVGIKRLKNEVGMKNEVGITKN